jgi:hypothetical protein
VSVKDEMVPAMHQLIRESILSVKPLMQRAKREHTFEIFGCGALPLVLARRTGTVGAPSCYGRSSALCAWHADSLTRTGLTLLLVLLLSDTTSWSTPAITSG